MDRPFASRALDPSARAAATHISALKSAERLASGPAWFSIAPGVAEVLAPRRVGGAAGMRSGNFLLRVQRLREIGTGIGLLTAKQKTPWLLARASGDVLDLATLSAQLGSNRGARMRTAASIVAVGVVTRLDLMAACKSDQQATQARNAPSDYNDRVGFSRPPDKMRGAARDSTEP